VIIDSKPDFCTLSPDTIGRFNWSEACQQHDEAYSASGDVSRWTADLNLWKRMVGEVNERDRGFYDRITGRLIAFLYWLNVRLFGWLWWEGSPGGPS
jgi:hypothetical protein